MGKNTGRQHGVADARRSDKQDVHFRRARRLIIARKLACQARDRCPVLPGCRQVPVAMSDTRFALLDDRGILAVSGADRRSFLQGLVSNDVEKVSEAEARYAALLTAQGKYLHDFMMVEFAGAVWLEVEGARLGDLKRRLSIYRLRANAALEEKPDLAVAVVFGDGALAVMGFSGERGTARPFASGVVFVDPRLAALGVRCVLPRADLR